MANSGKHPRILLLANRQKPLVTEALREFRPWLAQRAKIVADPDLTDLSRQSATALPQADFAMILGGDGTLLAQARHLSDVSLPILGVNFGKLGFLAEFSLEDVRKHWETIVAGRCRKTSRVLINVKVHGPDATGGGGVAVLFESVAINDAVITAGQPFRMIELELTIDPSPQQDSAATFSGDGVIISTPSGSTAYNLGAGGPIVSPDADALCITPICPHTLAFRPIVVSASAAIGVRVARANEGTTLVIDGQIPSILHAGEQVIVSRHPRTLTLLHNPDLSYWKMLARKMHWAARPRGR